MRIFEVFKKETLTKKTEIMKTTIEQLSEKLGGNLWVKGDMKRIYLDRGYNTKKMSTKTFIYEKDGEFKVSCWIECPSQSTNWINNERDRIIDNVENEISEALADSYFYIQSETGKAINDCGKEVEVGSLCIGSDIFVKKGQAKTLQREEELEGQIIEISRADFESAEESYSVERSKQAEEKKDVVTEKKVSEIIPTEVDMSVYSIGSKWNNKRFGLGEVISVDGNKVNMKFDGGVKSLLAKFAGLTPAE